MEEGCSVRKTGKSQSWRSPHPHPPKKVAKIAIFSSPDLNWCQIGFFCLTCEDVLWRFFFQGRRFFVQWVTLKNWQWLFFPPVIPERFGCKGCKKFQDSIWKEIATFLRFYSGICVFCSENFWQHSWVGSGEDGVRKKRRRRKSERDDLIPSYDSFPLRLSSFSLSLSLSLSPSLSLPLSLSPSLSLSLSLSPVPFSQSYVHTM